jgi:hypothetical protein
MCVPAGGGVSMQQSAKAVAAVTGATDGFEAVVRQHAAVLTAPATQHYLKLAAERFSMDGARREKLAAAAQFTAVCAAAGVEAALAYAGAGAAHAESAAAASAAKPAAASPGAASMPASDRRLIGHWRHTEHMSSGGVSMATDTHLVLSSDGSAICWSHSAGSFGEQRSPKEHGTWRTGGGTLSIDAGMSYSGTYQTDGDQLLLPGSGRYRLWTKVG